MRLQLDCNVFDPVWTREWYMIQYWYGTYQLPSHVTTMFGPNHSRDHGMTFTAHQLRISSQPGGVHVPPCMCKAKRSRLAVYRSVFTGRGSA